MAWFFIGIIFIGYFVLVLFLSSDLRRIERNKKMRREIDEIPPYYVLAYLAGGIRNVAFSILYRLNQEKIVEFNEDLTKIKKFDNSKTKGLSKFEQEFCSIIGDDMNISLIFDKNNLTRLKSLIDHDPFLLKYPEVIFTNEERKIRDNKYFKGFAAAVASLAVIFLGVAFGEFFHPLAGMFLLIAVGLIFWLIHFLCFSFPSNTTTGEYLKYHHMSLNPKPSSTVSVSLPLVHRITFITLYGPDVFSLLGWSEFKERYVRKNYSSSSSGSGCGTSCSSTSCGSSCSGGSSDGGSSCGGGGCGGCGGGD